MGLKKGLRILPSVAAVEYISPGPKKGITHPIIGSNGSRRRSFPEDYPILEGGESRS
jgi:hypothetical protein